MLRYVTCILSSALLALSFAGSASAQPAAVPPPDPTLPAPGAAQPLNPAPPGPATAAPEPLAPAAPALAAPAPAAPAPAAKGPTDQAGAKGVAVELTSLRLMREKGIISQAEYDSALKDLGESVGTRAADSLTFMLGKFSTTFYGLIEAAFIYDTTQSFNDFASNLPVLRPGTFQAEHGRMMFSIRDTRFGFRVRAPELSWVRASANIEADFFAAPAPGASETAVFANPALRVRNAYFKLETPVIDILVGQYWLLFGWQPAYFPNSVEYIGAPGEIFGRSAQIRLSKLFKGEAASLELAAAAVRPVQRDSATPELDAGIRFTLNNWNGMQTLYGTNKQVAPASIGVSGNLRQVALPEFTAAPKVVKRRVGGGIAVSAFLPVVPTPKGKMGHSLSLQGEFAYGSGIADRYTALVGGVANPPLPNDAMVMPPPTYTPNIDPGIAVFNEKDRTLELVQWTTFVVGAQYYFPKLEGNAWISANYARAHSSNAKNLGPDDRVWVTKDWINVNLFGDPTPFVRLGIQFARIQDTYADGVRATNYRGQFTGYLFF
jgi:hypothetical protein